MDPQNTAQKKYKILLVDDDHFLLNMYSIKFKASGFDVETSIGGLDALARLKGGMVPDIIMLDMIMPNIDGIETLSRIRKENLAPNAKVIILSNQNQPTDIDKAKALGIDGYIVKATTIPSEVVTEVERVIKK